uniref:Selenoprotein W n=1 Tax=Globisporangium ultimum (strain ATCC 200006 / CBS 805.95 / DAOM BR144) TaxID=431595 RepID=K3X1B2_GLOUD
MASSSALQVLAVLSAAVALQQYTSRRAQTQKAQKAAKEAAAAEAQRKKQQQVVDKEGDEAFVVEIEYCTGCRWMLRSAWIAQELLTTFQNDLRSVKLTPNSNQGGVFQVYVYNEKSDFTGEDKELLWSRKAAGRFPESKELKQIVRDYINPDKGLGHSDKK